MLKLSDYLDIQPMGRIIEAGIIEAAKAKTIAGKKHKREYAGGRLNRLNSGWVSNPVGANWSLVSDLRTLRARARQMAKDAPHFKKFLRMCRTNIIGPKGMQLMVRAYKADGVTLNTKLNKRVANVFWRWGHAEFCSATQKLNWLAAQRLFVTHLARDGEVLVQHISDPENPFGYSLKFWNVDYLDESYNEDLPNGNRIIMSVEIDANDRPVAYHMTTPPSEENFVRRYRERRRPVRIPAEQMIHSYLVTDDESQVRGVTWFHASLLEGRNLESYKNGVITSARVTALSMGFIETEVPDEVEFTGEEDEDGVEQTPEIDIQPASFTGLMPGQKVSQWDPKQPTQNHSEFKKTILQDIASGLDVNYFSLAGDLESVNYSSARVGLGEERDVWRELQEFVGEMFCRPVYHQWCRSALLSGKLVVTPREFEEIQDPMFRPRGWRYVDPQKEIKANIDALENKLATWTDVLAEQGIDITEHFETLKQEQELAASMGIKLEIAQKAPVEAKPELDEDDEEEETGKKKPKDDADRGYRNGHAETLPN